MTKEEFIKDLQEELEYETVLQADTNLKNLEEWDSMSAMILIGFVSDKFDITLNADDIKSITTINSLIDRIGSEKFE